jgi:hypothetical protein
MIGPVAVGPSRRQPRTVVFLMLSSLATAVQAQSRMSTLHLSCGQARTVVRTQGAAVLNTGPNTYDRFVSSPAFCALGETTEPVWVRTADTAQCPIGFRCRGVELEFGQ